MAICARNMTTQNATATADPDRVAVVELREAVLDADDRREEEVDRRDEDDDRPDRDRDALRVLEEPGLFLVIVFGVACDRLFA